MRVFSTLILLSLPAASVAAEQGPIASSVHAGERVRITVHGGANATQVVGVYRAGGAESLEVGQPDPHGGPEMRRAFPVDSLVSVEVSRGRTHNTLAGFLVGFLAGAAVSLPTLSNNNNSEIPPVGIWIYPVAFGLAGGLVGSGLGSERWEKVWDGPARP